MGKRKKYSKIVIPLLPTLHNPKLYRKVNTFFKLILVLLSVQVFAQDDAILQKGNKWVDYTDMNAFKRKSEFGSSSIITNNGNETSVFQFETITQPKFIYNFSVKLPTKKISAKKDQTFLLKFRARTIHSLIETGEARILWILKQSTDPGNGYKFNLESTTSLSKEWKTYYIPFKTTKEVSAEELGIVMQLGFPIQKFELSDLQIYVFDPEFNTALLPKTKIVYDGMEDNASWRKEAKDKIEKIRKSDFNITFRKNGKPVEGNMVNIELKKHDFNFGAAVEAKDVVGEPKQLDFISKMFNTIVFENDLKIKSWQNLKKQTITLDAIDVLKSKGIKIKGHALLWPGFRYLTEDFKQNEANPKKIIELSNAFMNDVLIKTQGNISHWDVTNENYTNKDLQKITGSNQIIYDAFKTAKMLDPNAERFINEYGIISSGGLDKTKQDWYYNYVKEIDQNTGNLVDGIGMQSHIGSDLTPPKTIMAILDKFSTLHKKIAISEFTMDITDPEIRGKYTRDFMISAFSNPAVHEFLFWGYFEPKSQKASLIDKDFNLTEMGKAYNNLVFGEWLTKINQKTNNEGKVSGRGFYGDYSYSIIIDKKQYVGVFRLVKGENNNYVIDLK